MDRADREDRKANLDNLNREIRPLAMDLVKIWSIQLGQNMKKDNLNPHLMIGDEITVVHVDESFGTLHTPERYKDYVVIGRRHRQPENWEGPDADTSYYVIDNS